MGSYSESKSISQMGSLLRRGILDQLLHRGFMNTGDKKKYLMRWSPFSIYCALDETIPIEIISSHHTDLSLRLLTLNVGNTLLQDLLKDLGVLELLGDLGDNALSELLLLTELDLSLISNP